jgi:hypothetical protein
MSIQPIEAPGSTLLLELIEHLDDFEARRCEHRNHGLALTHQDGGERFVKITAPCGCVEHHVLVLCEHFLRVAVTVRCPTCDESHPKQEVYTDLGPANAA